MSSDEVWLSRDLTMLDVEKGSQQLSQLVHTVAHATYHPAPYTAIHGAFKQLDQHNSG